YGATVHRSADGGATWERAEEIGLPEESELKLARTWHVEPGHDERTLWLGGDPGALLRSTDGGETFEMVPGLTLHPTRERWNPGGVYRSAGRGDSWERLDGNGLPSGFGFPIMLHPRDPDTALVIPEEGAENRVTSNGRLGVYRTRDGGASWELASKGLPEQAWEVILRE